MKALILVGGFGTRLRPLTFSCPKPLVEFANKPIVEHQIEVLANVGVKEIVLAVGFQPGQMTESIKDMEKKYNVNIICSLETEPLGTSGPIRLAKDMLIKDNPEQLIFVFNSDIICEYNLTKLIKHHKESGAEGTIYLTEVSDPTKFGVVVTDQNHTVKRFVEKPKEFISNRINAGLYIFSTKIIDRIPLQPSMLEKDIFPKMAQEGVLSACLLDSYWMDVGTPSSFLEGTTMYLESLNKNNDPRLVKGKNIIGNVIIHEETQIDPDSLIGPNVTIDKGCVVEKGARLKNVVLMKGAHIKANAWINNSIVGWRSSIGKWVRVEGVSVFGEDTHVRDELFINGVSVLPHKSVSENITQQGTIIM